MITCSSKDELDFMPILPVWTSSAIARRCSSRVSWWRKSLLAPVDRNAGSVARSSRTRCLGPGSCLSDFENPRTTLTALTDTCYGRSMTPASDAFEAAGGSWRETLLDDLLGSIFTGSSVFFRVALPAPWGLRLDANAYRAASTQFRRMKYPSREPGHVVRGRLVPFHIVAAGSCWLEVEGEPSGVQLAAGDLVVLPQEHAHVLRDALTSRAIGLLDLVKASPPSPNGELNALGVGLTTRLVCGAMPFDNARTNPLLAALPPLIYVKGSEEGGAPWLRLTVQHAIDELASDRPGAEAVVGRLADILFIGAIRSYLEESLASAESGWLASVRDQQIGRAIALLHRDPARPWTVEMLADQVALSRSALASKFTRLVGEPPLRYLTRVRLDAAARRLRDTKDNLSVVAVAAGYESLAAFTRAFERHVGVSPGEYRRAQEGPESGGP